MNPSALSNLIVSVSIIVTIAVSTAVLYGLVRLVNVWAFRAKANARPQVPPVDSEAIGRLQASVDAISIEVERISEGQRFTTKLMNERIPERELMPTLGDRSRLGQQGSVHTPDED